MTTPPDWKALVAACGADPALVRLAPETLSAVACEVHTPHGGTYAAIKQQFGAILWCVLIHDDRPNIIHQSDDARAAIAAALAYLRAQLRREIAEREAALRRLGWER